MDTFYNITITFTDGEERIIPLYLFQEGQGSTVVDTATVVAEALLPERTIKSVRVEVK